MAVLMQNLLARRRKNRSQQGTRSAKGNELARIMTPANNERPNTSRQAASANLLSRNKTATKKDEKVEEKKPGEQAESPKPEDQKQGHALREESPTSINMRSSFILQNQNKSFDRYFNEMRRRNQQRGLTTTAIGTTYRNNSRKVGASDNDSKLGEAGNLESSFYRSQGKGRIVSQIQQYPAARDGHFAGVFQDHLVVFGGDRHLMAFNDLHAIKVQHL